MAIEEPAYTVTREGPGFELRCYQPQLLAETKVDGRFDQAGNQAWLFMRSRQFSTGSKQGVVETTGSWARRVVWIESKPF